MVERKSRAPAEKSEREQKGVKLDPAAKALLDGLAGTYGQDRGEFVERLLIWFKRQSPAVANWGLGIGWQPGELRDLDRAASSAVEAAASEIVVRRHRKEKGAEGAG